MSRFPVLSVGALLGASMMRMRPLGFGLGRIRASKYKPHIGKKEQERAKRCYMVSAYVGGVPRSAPTMNQMSKREYATQMAEQQEKTI